VYVAGDAVNNASNYSATLWQNGVPAYLTSGVTKAAAKGVYVSGTDVYVAGYEHIGSYDVARIWKNGVATSLSAGTSNAQANAVFISGTDVYVAGYEFISGSSVARVWKNGVATSLPSGTAGVANGIFVSGSNVYVAGSAKGVGTAGANAVVTLWANGGPIYYSDGAFNKEARSVFILGTDVYLAGGDLSSGNGFTLKNGVSLQNFYRPVNSVFVSGTDVYSATAFQNGFQAFPAVYKNSSVSLLQNLAEGAAYAVYVFGTDVYAAGYELTTPNVPRLWKNAVGTTLPSTYNNGHAYSIFITP